MRMYQRLSMIITFALLVAISVATVPAGADTYQVYFQSNRDGDNAIYRVDGDDAVRITDFGCEHPSVTADNSMLFYTHITETLWGRFWNVYYILNGEDERRLSRNEIYDELDPVISRDGTFASFTTFRSGNLEVITVPMDHNDLQFRITDNQNPDELPALGTGDEYVYWTARTGNHSYIFRTDGRGEDEEFVRISNNGVIWDEHPSVSADGRFIAYASVDMDTVVDEEDEDEDEEDSEEESDVLIKFEDERVNGNYEIWIYDTVTDERTQLTFDPAWDANPCISADGNRIVFTSDRDGNKEIYMINRDGTGLMRLTENEADDDFAAIT